MKLIVGNQKTYINKEEVKKFIEETKDNLKKENVVVCPSYPFLYLYENVCPYGGQNVSIKENGATTGEISATQLKSVGSTYCLVGHSERRANQKETDEEIHEKIVLLLEEEIIPILCVGETLEEREQKRDKEVVKKELLGALTNISKEQMEKIIIAYEPIWAIGTGLVPTNDEIEEITKYIKNLMKEEYDAELKVLYGGSVSQKNIDTLNEIEIVDGYLIGGASVRSGDFNYIINSREK